MPLKANAKKILEPLDKPPTLWYNKGVKGESNR